MTPLQPGTRVQTIYGRGLVAYARMAPPEYARPDVYSVVLDHKVNKPGYTGTIVNAIHVSAWVTEDVNA